MIGTLKPMKTKTINKAPRLNGAVAARKLCKQGYPLAAIRDLWKANQPRLGLGDCRDIVQSWGFLQEPSASVKASKG